MILVVETPPFTAASASCLAHRRSLWAWRVFLCDKKRHAVNDELVSCFDIWHKAWRNGTLAPASKKGSKKPNIKARAPARQQEEGDAENGGEVGEQSSDASIGGSAQTKRARRATEVTSAA
ncbi:hypothetical protein PC121_g235 [Phytophthora cactorum]|nr:hypothetical protein PC120_g201 [Phytophthora cactorum]KAG3106074.1 hypothetical protein PC121_g235 [Phytophthora cactorum]